MEDWKYHSTYSGCPQGGIASPLLSNIYLNELDKFAAKMAKEFYRKKDRMRTHEYEKMKYQIRKAQKEVESSTGDEKATLLKLIKQLKAEKLKTPCASQTDKVLKYIRYADDFIIGVKGNKTDCEDIKSEFSEFISQTLKMELSEEKTLITHSSQSARFLGYDIQVRRNSKIKLHGKHRARTLNYMVELNVPFADKIMPFLFDKSIIEQAHDGSIEHISRKTLIRCSDFEIVSTYNSELRGICNYYGLASNFNKLGYFAYLMEYSCLKTLANKHKSTTRKILNKYQDGKSWSIPYQTEAGQKRLRFAKFMDCKSAVRFNDVIGKTALMYKHTKTPFEQKIAAKVCELCGRTNTPIEMHHVNKVKNIKGKATWELMMIAKRRKTLAVCKDCHHKIHNP